MERTSAGSTGALTYGCAFIVLPFLPPRSPNLRRCARVGIGDCREG